MMASLARAASSTTIKNSGFLLDFVVYMVVSFCVLPYNLELILEWIVSKLNVQRGSLIF